MELTIFVPEEDSPAIEERYAARQLILQLVQSAQTRNVHRYGRETTLAALAAVATSERMVIATTATMVVHRSLASQLSAALDAEGSAVAAIPATNLSDDPRQIIERPPYLTLGQFDDFAEALRKEGDDREVVTWGDADPNLVMLRREWAQSQDVPIADALRGRNVVVARRAYVHAFPAHRAQSREDLLERIPTTAASILEFGCGEGVLGAAVKSRQQCRYVGVELDARAAAIAQTRLDSVFAGDVRDVASIVNERFDFIVGGDVLEHIDDPWTFLAQLRELAKPGARLLLSLPNICAWPMIRDLLRGRFDYVYMGIACAGHLRFFSRRTIEDLLAISGWTCVSITGHDPFEHGFADFAAALEVNGIPLSHPDLLPVGHYVLAEHDPAVSPL